MPASVAKPDIKVYSWEINKAEDDTISLIVTLKYPVSGGWEYMQMAPVPTMTSDTIVPVNFADIRDYAEDMFAAASITLTGDWPTYPELS